MGVAGRAVLVPADRPHPIVRVGPALLVDGAVRRERLEAPVSDVAERVAAGRRIAIVSSGAIALRTRRRRLAREGCASLEDEQTTAS